MEGAYSDNGARRHNGDTKGKVLPFTPLEVYTMKLKGTTLNNSMELVKALAK